jgi:adenine deaminase
MEDLRDFRVHQVFKNGRLVAKGGAYLAEVTSLAVEATNTVHAAPVDESAFRLSPTRDNVPVIRIVPGQLVTRAETQPVERSKGQWTWRPERDQVLIASIERHRKTGRVGLGLVSGFNLRKPGALGSSVAHDSHNLIIAGTNPRDMLACVRWLEKHGGGFVCVSDGEVCAELPLPVGGLLSTSPADMVCQQLRDVRHVAQGLGCELNCPFGMLSFLALPVIPELKMTDRGPYDVARQEFIKL